MSLPRTAPRPGSRRGTGRETRRALGRLDPFELKNRLVALADASAKRHARAFLDAGRGNPDWLSLAPREAFVLLGAFAIEESRRQERELPDASIGGLPVRRGIARRLRSFLARLPASDGARLVRRGISHAVRELGAEADALVHEWTDGVAGCHYAYPVRMLVHAERIVRAYLGPPIGIGGSAGRLDLFAVEGATAGICYLFDSLFHNGVLRRGDRVAVATPVFAPYLEIPKLRDYGLRTVRIEATESRTDGSHAWQIPDAALERLGDRSIRAFVVVNPGNPTSVALAPRTVARIAALVRRLRPDLLVVSDDVYAEFVPGYRSLAAALPANTALAYSFSKYFGATGWRLGVVALRAGNVIDRLIARQPAARRAAVASRYASLALDPARVRFIDRMAADSRRVALNHTAGLSTPQQVQMTLFALAELLDRDRSFNAAVRSRIDARLRALYRGLGAALPADALRAGYYCELDLMVWAAQHYGRDFARFLAREHDPVDIALALARGAGIVVMPGEAFGAPRWSVRVSLANVPEAACRRIGAALHAFARGRVRAWRRRPGSGSRV